MGKTRFLLFALLVAGAVVSGCRDRELVKDMVRFDRHYVPALAATASSDDAGKAVMAVKMLKLDWFAFKSKYSGRGWGAEFSRIEDMIMDADGLINGNDFKGAHRALEGVRAVLIELRRGEGIDYFPDYLTDFHGPMESIVKAVDGKTPGTLGQREIEGIRRSLRLAAGLWDRAEAAGFNRNEFGLSKAQEARLREYMRLERAALLSLESALAAGDVPGIIDAARGLRPPFADAYRLFGDFDSLVLGGK
jgi:hypothetical protein